MSTSELKRYIYEFGCFEENPNGNLCKVADTTTALDEIKRQVWNEAMEAAAQNVESLWAFRTCREVADAIRDMKKDS
jgi:hypothetical protein